MKCITSLSTLGLACLLATCGLFAGAQTDTHTHTGGQGMMHRMMGHLGHQGQMGRMPAMSGRIIGNKRSHVYHLPGDKGSLPDPKNRTYFRSEAEARAAGYHSAGRSPMGRHNMGGHGMSHGMMGHGKMGHDRMDHGKMDHGKMDHP